MEPDDHRVPNLAKGVRFGSGQDPTRGGRRKKPDFASLIEDAMDADGVLKFPQSSYKIDAKGNCIVTLANKERIAFTLLNKALSDPRWMDMFLKVAGLYKATKLDLGGEQPIIFKRQPEK